MKCVATQEVSRQVQDLNRLYPFHAYALQARDLGDQLMSTTDHDQALKTCFAYHQLTKNALERAQKVNAELPDSEAKQHFLSYQKAFFSDWAVEYHKALLRAQTAMEEEKSPQFDNAIKSIQKWLEIPEFEYASKSSGKNIEEYFGFGDAMKDAQLRHQFSARESQIRTTVRGVLTELLKQGNDSSPMMVEAAAEAYLQDFIDGKDHSFPEWKQLAEVCYSAVRDEIQRVHQELMAASEEPATEDAAPTGVTTIQQLKMQEEQSAEAHQAEIQELLEQTEGRFFKRYLSKKERLQDHSFEAEEFLEWIPELAEEVQEEIDLMLSSRLNQLNFGYLRDFDPVEYYRKQYELFKGFPAALKRMVLRGAPRFVASGLKESLITGGVAKRKNEYYAELCLNRFIRNAHATLGHEMDHLQIQSDHFSKENPMVLIEGANELFNGMKSYRGEALSMSYHQLVLSAAVLFLIAPEGLKEAYVYGKESRLREQLHAQVGMDDEQITHLLSGNLKTNQFLDQFKGKGIFDEALLADKELDERMRVITTFYLYRNECISKHTATEILDRAEAKGLMQLADPSIRNCLQSLRAIIDGRWYPVDVIKNLPGALRTATPDVYDFLGRSTTVADIPGASRLISDVQQFPAVRSIEQKHREKTQQFDHEQRKLEEARQQSIMRTLTKLFWEHDNLFVSTLENLHAEFGQYSHDEARLQMMVSFLSIPKDLPSELPEPFREACRHIQRNTSDLKDSAYLAFEKQGGFQVLYDHAEEVIPLVEKLHPFTKEQQEMLEHLRTEHPIGLLGEESPVYKRVEIGDNTWVRYKASRYRSGQNLTNLSHPEQRYPEFEDCQYFQFLKHRDGRQTSYLLFTKGGVNYLKDLNRRDIPALEIGDASLDRLKCCVIDHAVYPDQKIFYAEYLTSPYENHKIVLVVHLSKDGKVSQPQKYRAPAGKDYGQSKNYHSLQIDPLSADENGSTMPLLLAPDLSEYRPYGPSTREDLCIGGSKIWEEGHYIVTSCAAEREFKGEMQYRLHTKGKTPQGEEFTCDFWSNTTLLSDPSEGEVFFVENIPFLFDKVNMRCIDLRHGEEMKIPGKDPSRVFHSKKNLFLYEGEKGYLNMITRSRTRIPPRATEIARYHNNEGECLITLYSNGNSYVFNIDDQDSPLVKLGEGLCKEFRFIEDYGSATWNGWVIYSLDGKVFLKDLHHPMTPETSLLSFSSQTINPRVSDQEWMVSNKAYMHRKHLYMFTPPHGRKHYLTDGHLYTVEGKHWVVTKENSKSSYTLMCIEDGQTSPLGTHGIVFQGSNNGTDPLGRAWHISSRINPLKRSVEGVPFREQIFSIKNGDETLSFSLGSSLVSTDFEVQFLERDDKLYVEIALLRGSSGTSTMLFDVSPEGRFEVPADPERKVWLQVRRQDIEEQIRKLEQQIKPYRIETADEHAQQFDFSFDKQELFKRILYSAKMQRVKGPQSSFEIIDGSLVAKKTDTPTPEFYEMKPYQPGDDLRRMRDRGARLEVPRYQKTGQKYGHAVIELSAYAQDPEGFANELFALVKYLDQRQRKDADGDYWLEKIVITYKGKPVQLPLQRTRISGKDPLKNAKKLIDVLEFAAKQITDTVLETVPEYSYEFPYLTEEQNRLHNDDIAKARKALHEWEEKDGVHQGEHRKPELRVDIDAMAIGRTLYTKAGQDPQVYVVGLDAEKVASLRDGVGKQHIIAVSVE